ncbi:NUDIX hydrolase domain-like protein [Xylariaceae sp. FL0804]|nr:NUDIX hydrolase domain-like protein [Xylariaceae sp. FL0804]
MSALPVPRVGVAAIVRNDDGDFVMGKRTGSHDAGTWQFPGGHLEMGESFLACAARECLEETGLRVAGVRVVAVTNDVFDETKHYITIFVLCRMLDPGARPEVLEPEKCEGWHWVGWDRVRQWCEHHDETTGEWADKKCFLPIRNLVKEYGQLDLST